MQSDDVAREDANGRAIHPKPEVRYVVVTCIDGFGNPGEKHDDYRIFDNLQLIQYSGLKLFYKKDMPLMSPAM